MLMHCHFSNLTLQSPKVQENDLIQFGQVIRKIGKNAMAIIQKTVKYDMNFDDVINSV